MVKMIIIVVKMIIVVVEMISVMLVIKLCWEKWKLREIIMIKNDCAADIFQASIQINLNLCDLLWRKNIE